MADTVTNQTPQRRYELSEQANRKVFKRLIPFLLLMYVIAFLDRSNVSFAQEEFEADFGISTAAYAFGAGLFFVGKFQRPQRIQSQSAARDCGRCGEEDQRPEGQHRPEDWRLLRELRR